MRVLYFHQHFTTPRGASGIRSYAMAQRLIEEGHKVTMVCGSPERADTGLSGSFHRGMRSGMVDGIEVIEFDLQYSNADGFVKRSMTFLRFALRSIGLALTRDYDLVFATSTPLTAGIPGVFARWLRRKPFVFEVRDLWPELPREMGVITNPVILGLMSFLEWATYRSAHRLIGLSPGIVAGIERRGVDPERIAMIPNGCDLDIFGRSTVEGTDDSAASERRKPETSMDAVVPWRPDGVAESDLMAIFTGAHGIANGLDAVLDAAVELKRRGRDDIKLVLVGDGKLKPALQERAKAEDLRNVIFHPPVPKHRLAGLMAAADIGLQILANVPAFYYGTSPNKFFDYIAAGRPVLNNYPGWLADTIREHNCGFAVPPDDPAAFADALEQAAADRDRLKEMGLRARKLAQSEFARNKLSAQFVAWLRDTA